MNDKLTSIPKTFVVTLVGLAVLVFAFAIVKGNQPIFSPDLSEYVADLEGELVTSEWLADSIIKGDSMYRAVSLRTETECAEQVEVTSFFQCLDQANLNDSYWVRKEFRSINEPLLIMGSDTEDGLNSAANLKYWGYNDIKVLAGGFNNFALSYLQPEFAEINVAEADRDELKQLAAFRYFTGNDPLVKRKGETWAMAMGNESYDEQEVEGSEEGGDGEEDDDDWAEFEDDAAEEGC